MTVRETWWLAPGVEARLRADGLDTVAGAMAAAAKGVVLSTDRNSAAVRLAGPTPVLLKWRRPRRGKHLRTFGRASRERKEACALLRARARGLPCPYPLAVGERRESGILRGAVVMRPYLPAAEPAGDLLERDADGRLGALLAAHLRAWHETGMRHRDCYPKNVLVDPRGPVVIPIGFPAARFVRPGPRLDRSRRRDLAQWTVGLEAARPGASLLAFLEAYAGAAPGLPSAERLEARIRPARDRILAKKARREATRPRREPHGAPLPQALAPDASAPRREVRPLSDLLGSGSEA